MSSYNKTILLGNLTKDPELKYLPNGQAVSSFTLAINRVYTVDGERREDVTFINCVAWARRAEVLSEFVKKGDSLHLDGRLQTRSWDAQDGSKRYSTEVVVENFTFLTKKDGKAKNSTPVAPAQTPPSDLGPDDEIPF